MGLGDAQNMAGDWLLVGSRLATDDLISTNAQRWLNC